MTEPVSENERLLTAIYIEQQLTNKFLGLLSEQLGATFREAGRVLEEFSQDPRTDEYSEH